MKNVDINFFPGWVRKSVTFTIDDGNIKMDKKFLDIVKPAGILGTFNLHRVDALSPEEYRQFYRGYEIANHCKHHPLAFKDGQPYVVSDEPLDRTNSLDYTPDNPVVYKSDVEGLYYMHHNLERIKPDGWYSVATEDAYLRFAEQSLRELEDVFGKGSIKGFVWPYGRQTNTKVNAGLRAAGYNSIRRTSPCRDTHGYALPPDRNDWTYTANNLLLLEEMEKYAAYPDDGELKFFSFGVHSVDFERSDNWGDLVEFAEKYGNRPETYYYASVSDILEYQDAVNSVTVTDTSVTNPSERTLYIKVDDKRVTLHPHSEYQL